MEEQTNQVFTKKNIISFLVIGILLLSIPFGVRLALEQTQLRSRAAVNVITFVQGDTVACKTVNNKEECTTTSDTVPVELRSPLGPPGPTYTPTPTPTTTPVPTATPTPTLAPGSWIINTEAKCPAGQTTTVKSRIYYAIWPKYPLSSVLEWNYDNYATGIHTVSITATAPQGSGATQAIYVGMETESGQNLTPVPPPTPNNTAMTFATMFNPPTEMVRWYFNELPAGVYNINFGAAGCR